MAGRSLNKVMLIGNLGRDPEVRFMQSGMAVATLSIATSEKWKDKDNNWQEKTEWHRVVFFGKPAEVIGEYMSKGSKMYVEGRLQTREWEKDGQKRYTTEIVGREFMFLDSKGGGGGGGGGSDYDDMNPPPPGDEDIPF